MKLFKVIVYIDNMRPTTIYVVAKSETEASDAVMTKWKKEWDYSDDAYVREVELIATEGQFGKPETLLRPEIAGEFGKDSAWPLKDVLSTLAMAADILLHKKDYDGHNYEEINICINKAKAMAAELNKDK